MTQKCARLRTFSVVSTGMAMARSAPMKSVRLADSSAVWNLGPRKHATPKPDTRSNRMPVAIAACDPTARGMNRTRMVPHQTNRVVRINVAILLKNGINPGRSQPTMTNSVGLRRPTDRIGHRTLDSAEISGRRVLRRTVRDRTHLTCETPATPVIKECRSPAPARGAIRSRRQIAIRILSRSADQAPVTKAAIWIAEGIGPIPDSRRIRITRCPVSRNAANRGSPAGARLRRWGKTTGIPARWARARRSKADRKCEISMARRGFRWLRSSVKCVVHLR